LLNPLTGPFRAIGYFSQFIEPHYSYFNGQYLANTEIPWYYVIKWLFLTPPEFALIGLIAALIAFAINPTLQLGLIAFSAFFPIAYAAIMHTPFYDGYRHVLFIVPPLITFSAIGIAQIITRLHPHRIRNIATLIIGGLMLWALIYMIRLHLLQPPHRWWHSKRI